MKRETDQLHVKLGDSGRTIHWWRWGFLLSGLVLAVIVISCSTVNRTVVAPPRIPGATYVGSDACSDCHFQISEDFHTASHARLMAPGDNDVNAGCESCHGPASKHVESGGMFHTIVNPKKSPSICFDCHLDKRGQFHLASSHPVLEGHMSCSDCHNPHKGDAIMGGGTSLMSANEACLRCHAAQRGPHVFEHEALREGCTTCHAPHGSVNEKMLTARNANLCLKCHFQRQTVFGEIVIGERPHSRFLSQGTCWSAGCHEAVHGSQVNSHLRF